MAKQNKFGINKRDPDLAESRIAAQIVRGMLLDEPVETQEKVAGLVDALYAEIERQDIGELTLTALMIVQGRVINADS